MCRPWRRPAIPRPRPRPGRASLRRPARRTANHFQTGFKQPFVIETRPGAGSGVGAAFVAQAAPDGYTLLISNTAGNLTVPLVSKNFTYDPVADFTHIVMLAGTPYALC